MVYCVMFLSRWIRCPWGGENGPEGAEGSQGGKQPAQLNDGRSIPQLYASLVWCRVVTCVNTAMDSVSMYWSQVSVAIFYQRASECTSLDCRRKYVSFCNPPPIHLSCSCWLMWGPRHHNMMSMSSEKLNIII